MTVVVELTLRQAPPLRVDLRGLLPSAVAGLGVADIERLAFGHGRHRVPLAEWFAVARHEADGDAPAELRLRGDCGRFDHVGANLAEGRIVVDGDVGDQAGLAMRGGELRIGGRAGLLTGCELAGGVIDIAGDVGDFAAGAQPGSLDGMRGGLLVVRGHAGQRFGDRMRRGTALVFGDVGDFLASRLVAGTIAVGGRAGAHVGYGMRRGTVVLPEGAAAVAPTFVPAIADAPVAWQLIARSLARHGGPFAALPARRTVRHRGDLAAQGQGELVFVRP